MKTSEKYQKKYTLITLFKFRVKTSRKKLAKQN